eukprot:scaffold36781_cov50-Phaeocystis_antarctica.AAC.1
MGVCIPSPPKTRMAWGCLYLCTCETPCERSRGLSFICAWLEFGVQHTGLAKQAQVRLVAKVSWAGSTGQACLAILSARLGGPRRLRAVIGARAGLGDCAAAMVRAHRHGTARLGALVLDQSRIFVGWSTVARGGRGLRVRSHLTLACERRVTGGRVERGTVSNSTRATRRLGWQR